MESRKSHSSSSEDRSFVKRSSASKSAPEPARSRSSKEREKHKNSYIPVLKGEKIDPGNLPKIQKKSSSSSKICRSEPQIKEKVDDFEENLKLIQEKKKSVAEYYQKVEERMQKFISDKDEEKLEQNCIATCGKIISEPVLNRPVVKNDILTDFELNVQQISDIWLATSSNFSSTLKNLTNCSSLHPVELEMENVKIQLAIKKAKSLTLIKTRNVIEEVKKLIHHRELIRSVLENLLNNRNLKLKCGKCGSIKVVLDKSIEDCADELSKLGTGDSFQDRLEGQEDPSETSCAEENETRKESKESLLNKLSVPSRESGLSEEKEKNSGEKEESDFGLMEGQPSEVASSEFKDDDKDIAKEIAQKNETITNLNNKIFKLQKTINEQSVKYNELQVKLTEFHEKIQWNQVLWKQIGKLKEQIRGLQQSNKQLECQKKELESRITRLDQEMDRLVKMNELLNKKKFLLSTQEDLQYKNDGDLSKKAQKDWERKAPEDKAVAEKQNAITQLQTILTIMTDQKNLAQQQICLYQTKIEELEKMLKRNNVV